MINKRKNHEQNIISEQYIHLNHEESCSCEVFSVVKINFNNLLESIKILKKQARERDIKVKFYTPLKIIRNTKQEIIEINEITKIAEQTLVKFNIDINKKDTFNVSFETLNEIQKLKLGLRIGDTKFNKIIEICFKIENALIYIKSADNDPTTRIKFVGI